MFQMAQIINIKISNEIIERVNSKLKILQIAQIGHFKSKERRHTIGNNLLFNQQVFV